MRSSWLVTSVALAGLLLAAGCDKDLYDLMPDRDKDRYYDNEPPEDASDDLTWRGRDAIYQRYVTLVFPGNPQEAGAVAPQITIDGDGAAAVSTTHIGSEIAPAGDRWSFVRRDGRWWIASLTYNLEE